MGTIKIAQTVGPDGMYQFQRAFGFGQRTDLGFPNEAPGAVKEPSTWSGTSLPTIAIGQGISVTPMQMLMAYNVIANGGVYVPPKLVQSTVDGEGVSHPTAAGEGRRVVSEATSDELNVMLRSVVSTGTGQAAAITGYPPAGKTGTARKVQPGGNSYTDVNGAYHYQSTFVGFVPAEQPALSVYVMIDEPSGGAYTGGATAAPAFSKIGSFALRRLGIPPAATDSARDGAPVETDRTTAPGTTPSLPGSPGGGDRVPGPATGSPAAATVGVRRCALRPEQRKQPKQHFQRPVRQSGSPHARHRVTAMVLGLLAGELPGAQVLEPAAATGGPDVEITDVVHDSRSVRPGALFCCVPGALVDGHGFATEAVAAGASALLVERPLDVDVPQVLVADARAAMGPLAAAFLGHPSEALTVVGVTGTNGKTTTTHLLANVMDAAGRRCEVLGTLSGTRTTPEAPDLQRQLAAWRDTGVEVVAMEVSSHALELHRVDGTRFRVAVFTNLSRDHLDFHGSMESYFATKARLFEPSLSDQGRRERRQPLRPSARRHRHHPHRPVFDDRGGGADAGGGRFVVPVAGSSRCASRSAVRSTWPTPSPPPMRPSPWASTTPPIARGLSQPFVLAGRFELVEAGQPFPVIVDYAHTPDGLEELLTAAAGALVRPGVRRVSRAG